MRLYTQFVIHQNRRILFLINPFSDEKKSLIKWNRLVLKFPFLKSISLEVQPKAINILKIIDKYHPQYLGIAGGDGTANFIVKSIYSLPLNKQPIICPIPLGFGNALAYNLNINDPDQAINLLLSSHKSVRSDLIKTSIPKHSICLFNISVGFDARIVYYRQKDRYIGFKSYIISALRSLFDSVPKTLKITADNKVNIESETESLVIANMPIIGQNFQITPNSTLTNGLLDCVLFPSKYAYITNLRFRGFTHPLYKKTGKVYFSAKTITVNHSFYIQIDGDPIKYPRPFTVTVLPKKIKLLVENIN